MKQPEINKILVPVDFSDHSINAYKTAIAIARRHNATVNLMYVFDTDNNLYPERPVHNRFQHPGDVIRSLEELAMAAREDFSISCDITYGNGAITTSILQKAIETGSDIIIMGKNGHSGERAMYAGSHTYDVIKKAHCPVLMVTGNTAREDFANVLFPVRPVISVLEKYNIARPILTRNKGSVHLMGMRDPVQPSEVHIISKLMNLLKQSADEDGLDTKMTYFFNDNKFASHVLNTAASSVYKFDLVVITAELDEMVREFYLGEYAQQIIHQSTTPLLVIRATREQLPKEKVIQVLERETSVF